MAHSRRELLSLSLVGGAALAIPRPATAAQYELVHPRTCLAGHWGKPVQQWRVQFGVFKDEAGAERLKKALSRKGVTGSSHYIAIWLAAGDSEPMVVVSPALSKGKRARHTARALRRRGIAAFARHYVLYE